MNIVYASNDGYARHLAVSLYSLLEHNRDEEEIYVYLLSVEMSEANKEKLAAVAGEFGRPFIPVEMGNLKERFPYEIDTRGFDISAMARLFSGEMLPLSVKRAIYLDCDTVVLGPLKNLWETDMGGALVGMVMEPTAYPELKVSIGLPENAPYFNSGVLLMDLEGWRREQMGKQFLDFYGEKGGNLFACDQDTLNGALAGRIFPLMPKYNFFTNYRYFRYENLLKMSPSYGAVSKEAFLEARRRPRVVHFLGDERPWLAGNKNHYGKYYDYYLERTPWRGTPKETGKEFYMFLYFLMNQLTVVCPPARQCISALFGMKMIDARKKKKNGK